MKTNRSLMTVVLVLSLLFGVRAAVRAQSITLTSVSPSSFQAGPSTLTLTGTGFTPSCVGIVTELFNPLLPHAVATTYISSTQIMVSGTVVRYGSPEYYVVYVF